MDAGFDPFDMPNLKFTPSTQESIAINEKPGSAIIIAGSGMCTAGRIKHHLKHNLWRTGASIVIVGFQAKGTTGRKIVDGEKQVKIFRENVAVRAKVYPIGGFSAHADQADLLDWVSHFESRPKVFVVHGEITASETLAQEIAEKLNLVTHIPKWKEHLILKSKAVSVDEPVVEKEGPDVTTTLLNSIIDLENELKALRKRVKAGELDKETGEEQIDQLQYIQEELKTVLA